MNAITLFNEHGTCTHSIYKLDQKEGWDNGLEMGWKEGRLHGNVISLLVP